MNDDSPLPTELMQARVQRSRRFSPIWLIPIVTIGIAIWLAYDTLSKRGPLITVTFESAEGLVAGQSKVKHKDVDMGTVQSVQLSPDLNHVVVTARMNPEAERLLTDKAQLWVVKPRLFAGNLSGLETALSGTYIELLPSAEAGKSQRDFIGLENPPVLQSDVPGTKVTLAADRLGSISQGSPVYYRSIAVGEVLGWVTDDMTAHVRISAFIRAPFDRYIHDDTRFWDASGVSVQFGGSGVRLEIESLRALLLGGVAFDTPLESQATSVAAADTVFPLYSDRTAADNAAFKRRVQVVAYFPGSVGGLGKGSAVTIYGIRIGEVTSVDLEYDPASDSIRAPVHFEISPEQIVGAAGATVRTPLQNAQLLVNAGMRAQIESDNLILGTKAVVLAMLPNAPPAEVRMEGNAILLPTAPGQFAGLVDSVNALLTKVSSMPFAEIGDNLNKTLAGASALTTDPALTQAVNSLRDTLNSAHELVVSVAAGSAPALRRLPELANSLQDSLNRTNRLLQDVDTGYGDNSKFYRNLDRMMVQLNDTAESLRVLSDTLARHPEALIRGRPDAGTPK
jgi:paraquat-inducible protein B